MMLKQAGSWTGEPVPIGVFVVGSEPAEANLLGISDEAVARPQIDVARIGEAPESVVEMLERARAALAAHREGAPHPRFDLRALDAAARTLLSEILGEGEVEITLGVDPRFLARESVLPGLWRVQVVDLNGGVLDDWLEIGDVPEVVRAGAQAMTRPTLQLPSEVPEGAMNAPALLAEIAERMQDAPSGEPNHVINFTLLPMTPVDSALLTRTLGKVAFDSHSRGFGKAKVYLTAHRNVWGVQYYNGIGNVILDTLEIGSVPAALCAAQDDYQDSAQRLAEILEAYA